MSQTNPTEPDELTNHSDSSDESRTEGNNRAWSSISTFMTLLGARNNNQPRHKEQVDKIDEELSCPICQDIMKEVYATHCGHSFCHECITLHLENQSDCPICRSKLTRNGLYPNFQLNKLADYRLRTLKENIPFYSHKDSVEKIIQDNRQDPSAIAKSLADSLPSEDLEKILQAAIEQKKKMELDQDTIKQHLLCEFLNQLEKKNKMAVNDLIYENACITSDLKSLINQEDTTCTGSRKRKFSEIIVDDIVDIKRETDVPLSDPQDPMLKRMEDRFHDLKEMYHATLMTTHESMQKRRKLLYDLSSTIYELTRYDHFEPYDTLYYTDSSKSPSSIVSSIEFDRDQELFAVGGVTKEIKLFDFNSMQHRNQIHCPLRVMACGHKISCLNWSPYLKSQLASSDYEGFINIWDVTTGRKTQTFDEHKRRAWSVDISHSNPTMVASGSDDTTVKVWSLSQNKSIYTLEQKGNVCCAKFAPNNSHYLAVGSADHHVTCYDLRYPSSPVYVYKGHKKAVSYVKWINDEEFVSASTDSTLKLWDKESGHCVRTFQGHQNEKNFVGLSINGDWISCGSELNRLYTYHKRSTLPVATFKFPRIGTKNNEEEEEAEEEEEESPIFVSSVCWKNGTNKILAANSKGMIKVLEMK